MTDHTGFILCFGFCIVYIECFVGFVVCKYGIEALKTHLFNIRLNAFMTQNAERYDEAVARMIKNGTSPWAARLIATNIFESEFQIMEYQRGLKP